MRQAGAEMIAGPIQENLRLIFQAPKRARMNNARPVALKLRAISVAAPRNTSARASRPIFARTARGFVARPLPFLPVSSIAEARLRHRANHLSQRELFVIVRTLRAWSSAGRSSGCVEFSALRATLRQSNEPEIKKNNRPKACSDDSSQRIHPAGIRKPPRAGLNTRWMVLGVCLFLAAITWLVFGQTLRHEFINYDDGDYVFKNAQVAEG